MRLLGHFPQPRPARVSAAGQVHREPALPGACPTLALAASQARPGASRESRLATPPCTLPCPPQVAERVLHFWQNPNFVELVHENLPEVLPIVFPALYKSSKHHWNANVNGLAYTALRVMMHMDPELFEAYSVSYKQIRQQYVSHTTRRAGQPPRRAHALGRWWHPVDGM